MLMAADVVSTLPSHPRLGVLQDALPDHTALIVTATAGQLQL